MIQKENQQIHRQHPQEEAHKAVFVLLVAFFFSVAYMAIPSIRELYNFFPFSDQKLTVQTYAYFLLQEIYKCAIFYCVYLGFKNKIFFHFFLIQCFLMLDYIFTYNNVFFYILGFGIGSYRIALILWAFLFIKYTWDQSK